MEPEKKDDAPPLPTVLPEVLAAELRLRLPGVLQRVENLEAAKHVSREALELTIDT